MRTKVLIIDDDPVNNFICREMIKMVNVDCDMVDFTKPEDTLDYIRKNYPIGKECPTTILLLDLNMVTMTGWEFLEEFYKFDRTIIGKFRIYILSSSLDVTDKTTARQLPLVRDFIVKPLNVAILNTIFNSV